MIISVLITSVGFLGVVLAVFFVFFQIKKPIEISKKDMGLLIIWLALMIIGIVNLYYTYKDIDTSEPSISANGIDEKEASIVAGQIKDIPQTNDEDTTFSEEELLIKQNWDLIQQLKAEYLDEDTKIIKDNYVRFWIYEKAGYMYSDSRKSENFHIIEGNKVLSTKVIVLDYISDEIIYVFSPQENNFVEYLPGNQNVFYCIVFHENYDIYVTPPIQVVGGDKHLYFPICLNSKDDKYTPLFQMCAYKCYIKSEESYSACSSDYDVSLYCRNKFTNEVSDPIYLDLTDLGILSFGSYSYFSLNTNYIMDLSLYHESNEDLELSNSTFDGSVTNSNLVNIYFSISNENDIGDQTEEE